MTKGFVFGKFLPFHKGHQALIDFGARHCDELTVLVCASSREDIPGSVRKQWVSDTFNGDARIKVEAFEYDEAVLPNTSESSRAVSEIWAKVFSKLVPDTSILFSSEPYGAYVAEYMNIRHRSFDEGRVEFSISGSEIRKSVYEHFDYLPDSVKRWFQKKVVILGTESTGKSTLAQYLSAQFKSSLVPETGRDIIPDSRHFSIDQLRQIATGHAEKIKEAAQSLMPLIVIDTDVHITQSYAQYAFAKYLNLPEVIYHHNRADLYLYLSKDIPYIQDGTRLRREERDQLDLSHRSTLRHYEIETVELTGSYEERNRKAYELVKMLLNSF